MIVEPGSILFSKGEKEQDEDKSREFYEEIGEDYDEMLNRFTSEERVKKYALMFLKDDTFPSLVTSMESKDYETAFRNVHTLKGFIKSRLYETIPSCRYPY